MIAKKSDSSAPLIALAAGGTGGHVFPAEALARELLGRGLRVILLTDSRGGKFSDDVYVPTYRIHTSYLKPGLWGKIKSMAIMAFGTLQCFFLFQKLRPAAVVGFGGYPSVPPLYIAGRMGIPSLLHEQNAIIGRANKAMAERTAILATSFPHVQGLNPKSKTRVMQTGNPVRPTFASLRGLPYVALDDKKPVRIFVLGGSLGASVFSHVVPKAVALLPEYLRHRIVIAQQCRKDDLEAAQALFAGAGIEAELKTFFNDVPERMADAHLVVSRAGGSTVAELTAIGRPSILVPFPHGHAGEQMANGKAIADAGGAWLIPEKDFTPEALAVRLEALLTLPTTLSKAAAAARAWGTISAADNLANAVMEVVGVPCDEKKPLWESQANLHLHHAVGAIEESLDALHDGNSSDQSSSQKEIGFAS